MNNEYNDIAREMRRHIDNEIEMLRERGETLEAYRRLVDYAESLANEIEKLRADNESLRQQVADLETKLAEASKLSAGVAKKASQDDLEKALRIFLNISRRKTPSKREAAKTVITEMLASAKLDIPDDIRDMLDHLDDEQTEPKVVNVAGNYNDIHDNATVNQK